MASLVRVAVLKLSNAGHGAKITGCALIQQRNISGRCLRDSLPPRPPKPAPFDYVNNDYTWFRSLFDRTTHRFDDNSKVIVVEGPIAAGKTCFASQLAEDLCMKHYPEATMDYHYVDPYPVTLRSFDNDIPEDTRTYDHINFNLDPCHRNVAAFQLLMYQARYGQYIDALTHLLNTGQGVVLERSPFSDFVFMEAMERERFISKKVRSFYYELRDITLEELLRPHLVIYLDLPIDKVQEAIKCRGNCYEIQSKALTPTFLHEMERQYKDRYLQDISKHAELLVYDWSGGGDVDVVVEDIERLDFDQYQHREEPKMKDWRLPKEMDWSDIRMLYTNQKHILMNSFNVPKLDIPELIISAEDDMAKVDVISAHPDFKYVEGFTSKDQFSLKTKMPKYSATI